MSADSMEEVTGLVGNLQGYSTEDGPGIRSTVFLMGCPLRCRWCCNPEFLEKKPVTLCFDRETRTVGEWMTARQLTDRLLRDRIFYEESGGGVTFSGGEAGMQTEFVLQCAKQLHEQGIHVCLDTSGAVDPGDFAQLLSVSDLVLFDLKAADPGLHSLLTGQDNRIILENMQLLGTSNVPWRLRIVLVPGYNDSAEDVKQRLKLAADLPNPPAAADFLLYHELGRGKYKALGLEYSLARTGQPDPDQETRLRSLAEELGLSVGRYR